VPEVLTAIFYVLSTGLALPPGACRPKPRCTIILTCGIGTAPLARIHDLLYGAIREQGGPGQPERRHYRRSER
jgi:hypothetical protein